MSVNLRYPHIAIGVSSCLLGEHVRYDGGHRQNSMVINTLAHSFQLIPFCPEVAVGMGVPRPPMRLVQIDQLVHAQGVEDKNMDMTSALIEYGYQVAQQNRNLCGYVFKARSPSCGVGDTPLFDEMDKQIGQRAGLFAAQIQAHYPDMPIIDEARLCDEKACEQFIETILNYYNRDQA